MQEADRGLAGRAVRTRGDEVVSRRRRRFTTGEFLALCAPLGLEHAGQAVDDHIEEAADQEPEQRRAGGEQQRVDGVDGGVDEHHIPVSSRFPKATVFATMLSLVHELRVTG